MPFTIALHLLAVVIWVGGMFFAHQVLRPSAIQVLEPPLRLTLWVQVFQRFFVWVWLSIFILLGSGYWMLFHSFGGFASAPMYVNLMQTGGLIMVLIYFHVFFAPFQRLKQAVIIKDYTEAGRRLNQIRILVGTNIIIGLLVIIIGASGRYL